MDKWKIWQQCHKGYEAEYRNASGIVFFEDRIKLIKNIYCKLLGDQYIFLNIIEIIIWEGEGKPSDNEYKTFTIIVDINPDISIIILNVDGLYTPIKRQRKREKKRQRYVVSKKLILKTKSLLD